MRDIRQALFTIYKEIIDGEWGPYDDDHYWSLADATIERFGLAPATGPTSENVADETRAAALRVADFLEATLGVDRMTVRKSGQVSDD